METLVRLNNIDNVMTIIVTNSSGFIGSNFILKAKIF